jgi:RNA polymerase sigma-70 factor, ECF subfamily
VAPIEQAIWRDERPRIVGWLARRFGDLTLAEDATQEALIEAAVRWPTDGIPPRPGAWLSTTAYRKAIGILRKQHLHVTALADDAPYAAAEQDQNEDGGSTDDLFLLILTCCHPAFAFEQQVALTLRHVCGLSVSQIAACFLTSDDTMAKRLVRARSKIRNAGIPFKTPGVQELTNRLELVRAVIYLAFTEGYLTSEGVEAIDTDLCDEAQWLAAHLCAVHDDAESRGLNALILIQNARRAARLDHDGNLILFDDQDRTNWDVDAIATARDLLARSEPKTLGRYQVEAAIALLHVAGPEPDWAHIADLFGVLSRMTTSDVVEVNRAIAIGNADGPGAGLAILEPVLASGRLARYPKLHAAHATLLEANNQPAQAKQAWTTAANLTTNDLRRAAILRRSDEL